MAAPIRSAYKRFHVAPFQRLPPPAVYFCGLLRIKFTNAGRFWRRGKLAAFRAVP
jgi:hypothetical protein